MTHASLLGTEQHDTLISGSGDTLIVGRAGNDTIVAQAGNDLIQGDHATASLLDAPAGAVGFAQFGADGAWTVAQDPAGHTSMSQTVQTVAGTTYRLTFEVAANYGAGTLSGLIEVLWNGEVVDRFDTGSAVFAGHSLDLPATGGPGELTFRAIEAPSSGPEIHTDAPIFHYETFVEIGGAAVAVKAIAPGQTHIYQVIDGVLHVYDPDSESYTPAGAPATVLTNAIGFNAEDDLLYGIAVRDGVDSLGAAVAKSDLVMLDASGASFRVGATPYRSWTADFDDQGNLWAFEADMDRVTMIDVDRFDAAGNPLATTFKFPTDLVTDKVWDLAYDAASKTFYGLVSARYEGGDAKLLTVDISGVAEGGRPVFATEPVTSTVIDGAQVAGVPRITFGAFVIDGDGNLYAGGNGGDHDMDDATATSGGIYRIDRDAGTGDLALTLVADAPKAYSNDGAVDPRAMDPFTVPDRAAAVLIRNPVLVEAPDPASSYDDTVLAGAGQDWVEGGFGDDLLIGQSGGDTLAGGAADDRLFGGAGPEAKTWIESVYDAAGNRFDAAGNPLAADDDVLSGGAGDDTLSGAAGHDRLEGGAGDDGLFGGSGFDALFGGDGADRLFGGAERDELDGGAGEDRLDGGSGDDLLAGGIGDDVLEGSSGNDELHGDGGSDRVDGGSGDDVLTGGLSADILLGGSGDDLLSGDEADDRLDGGSGDDRLFGGAGRDHLKGGSSADRIEGGADGDYLSGHTGDDLLAGGAGKDRIYLGGGADTAFGGADADRFVFRADDLDGARDRIADFSAAEGDVLDLRELGLSEGWAADHIAWTGRAVEVDLGGATLVLDDHAGLGAGFADDVASALML